MTITVDDVESIVGTCKVLTSCTSLKLIHFKISAFGDYPSDPEYLRKELARERYWINKTTAKLPMSIQDIQISIDLISRRRNKLPPNRMLAEVEKRSHEVGTQNCARTSKMVMRIADYCYV
jgi:hypothetical protein